MASLQRIKCTQVTSIWVRRAPKGALASAPVTDSLVGAETLPPHRDRCALSKHLAWTLPGMASLTKVAHPTCGQFCKFGVFFSQISGSLQLLPTDSTFVCLNCKNKSYLLAQTLSLIFPKVPCPSPSYPFTSLVGRGLGFWHSLSSMHLGPDPPNLKEAFY